MLKLLQTIIDNVLLSVGYQHTFKLNSDEVLLHDLIKDITAPKEVPSAFQMLIEEGCSMCFAEHSAGLITGSPLVSSLFESATPTTDNDLPLIQSDQLLFVKEDCRLTDRQQKSALVPPAYLKALQTLSAL